VAEDGATATSTTIATSSNSKSYIPVAQREGRAQLTATPTLLVYLFFALQAGICNWTLFTERVFLASLGDDDTGNMYLMIFTLLTPVSILGVPVVDWVILHFGWTAAFQTTNLLAASFLVIMLASDNLNVQIIHFVIFSFYRTFLFGVSFSFLPTLISGDMVGKGVGFMNFSAGIVSLCLIPLSSLATKNESYDIPNLIFLSLVVPAAVTIQILGRYIRLEKVAKDEEGSVTEEQIMEEAMEEAKEKHVEDLK
jgi:hypothetical protein